MRLASRTRAVGSGACCLGSSLRGSEARACVATGGARPTDIAASHDASLQQRCHVRAVLLRSLARRGCQRGGGLDKSCDPVGRSLATHPGGTSSCGARTHSLPSGKERSWRRMRPREGRVRARYDAQGTSRASERTSAHLAVCELDLSQRVQHAPVRHHRDDGLRPRHQPVPELRHSRQKHSCKPAQRSSQPLPQPANACAGGGAPSGSGGCASGSLRPFLTCHQMGGSSSKPPLFQSRRQAGAALRRWRNWRVTRQVGCSAATSAGARPTSEEW